MDERVPDAGNSDMKFRLDDLGAGLGNASMWAGTRMRKQILRNRSSKAIIA